jgi:hypothetical protein
MLIAEQKGDGHAKRSFKAAAANRPDRLAHRQHHVLGDATISSGASRADRRLERR